MKVTVKKKTPSNDVPVVIHTEFIKLQDALKVIPSDEVTLELTNGLSPIVLTPVDDKYDFSYMVLPVRIKNS